MMYSPPPMLDGSVASKKHPFITRPPFQDYLEHYLMAESELSNRFHCQGPECGMEIVYLRNWGPRMVLVVTYALKAQFGFYVFYIIWVSFSCPFEIQEIVSVYSTVHTGLMK